MSLFLLNNIQKKYKNHCILSIPSLQFEPYTIYALVGPNGAGKTSLLRILALLDNEYEGEIIYKGETVDKSNKEQLRKELVFVSQRPVLFSGSVAYNIAYPLMLKNYPKATIQKKVGELLERVGLQHLLKSNAKKISGGEAQRVSLARALASEASVLLLDEPTASIDYPSQERFLRMIRQIWKEENRTIIFTSHDFQIAERLCHRFLYLVEGKIVAEQMYLHGQHYKQASLELCPQTHNYIFHFVEQKEMGKEEVKPESTAFILRALQQRGTRIYYSCESGEGEKVYFFTEENEKYLYSNGHAKERIQDPQLGDTFLYKQK